MTIFRYLKCNQSHAWKSSPGLLMFFEPNLIRLFSFYGTRFAGSGPPATSNIRGGGIGYGPPYGGYHQQGPPPRQPPPPRVSFFFSCPSPADNPGASNARWSSRTRTFFCACVRVRPLAYRLASLTSILCERRDRICARITISFPFTSVSLIVLLFSRWIGQPSIIWIRLLHFRLPRKTFLKLRGCCRLLFFCISFITLRRSPLVYIFFCPMLPFSWLLRHFIQSSERKTWNAKIGKHKLWTWCNGGTTTYTWLSY